MLDLKSRYTQLFDDPGRPSPASVGSDKLKGYEFEPADSLGRWVKPSDEFRFSEMPENLGGGQFITDPNQVGKLIRSKRFKTSDFKLRSKTRGGLPSWRYEVDHVIPIALGGSDNVANLAKLSPIEHEKKTKVGAVAQELYFNDIITLGQARNMVINWKDKDVEGVAIKSNGRMDLNDAKTVMEEWSAAPEVGFKEWWEEFKHPVTTMKSAGEKAGEGLDIMIPETKGGEFTKGLIESTTLDWIKFKDVDYGDEQLAADIARGTGKFAGFFVGYGAVAKLSKLAIGAAFGSKLLKNTKLAKDLPEWVKATRLNPIQDKIMRGLQNAGLFGLHGALSRQEEGGFKNRVTQFAKDASFGGLVAIPGQTLKGYAGLASGAYTLSAVEGLDPGESAFNTAIIVGLHGIGKIKDISIMNRISEKAAIEFRTKHGIKAKPPGYKYSSMELEAQNKRVAKKIYESSLSPEEAEVEIQKLIVSSRQLYKLSLPKKQRDAEDKKDVKSLFQWLNRTGNSKINKAPRDIVEFQKTHKKSKDIATKNIPENAPIGEMVTVGVAESVSPVVAKNIRNAIKIGAQKGDKVYFVLRDDQKFVNFLKNKNVKDPNNGIQSFIEKEGKFFNVGMWPTREKILQKDVGINARMDTWGLPKMNPEFNNNNVSEYLRGNGQKFLTGTIRHITGEAKVSGEPSIRISIGADDHAISSAVTAIRGKKIATNIKERISEGVKQEPKKIMKKIILHVR